MVCIDDGVDRSDSDGGFSGCIRGGGGGDGVSENRRYSSQLLRPLLEYSKETMSFITDFVTKYLNKLRLRNQTLRCKS